MKLDKYLISLLMILFVSPAVGLTAAEDNPKAEKVKADADHHREDDDDDDEDYDEEEEEEHEGGDWTRFLKIEGYGVLNYRQYELFTGQFQRDYRKEVDMERFVLKIESEPIEHLEIEAEIEYEHGGTGTTMELDEVEEFGEYEQEVESGGEVIVEEMYASYTFTRWLKLRGGHFYVPIGHLPFGSKPSNYHTALRGEAETRLLPSLWHETGFDASGWIGPVRYQAGIVNGLDSTGFSSANWVQGGHQTRFEKVRAEELAAFARLDVDFARVMFFEDYLEKGLVGAFVYHGGSAKNRPKDDFHRRMLLGISDYGISPEMGSADVDIRELHADIKGGPFQFRWMYMYGTLENADLVTSYNRKLSNNLGVTRNPVGSGAEAWFYEGSVDVLHWFSTGMELYLYVRYDYSDSMAHIEKVTDISQSLYNEEFTVDNPRWRWRTRSLGFHFQPVEQISIKGQYSKRTIDSGSQGVTRDWGPEYNLQEEEFILSLGFQF